MRYADRCGLPRWAELVLFGILVTSARAELRTWRLDLPPPLYTVTPLAAAANTVNGELYFADDTLMAVRQPGLRPGWSAPLRGVADTMVFCGQENKLYCLTDSAVVVVDCEGRQVLGELPRRASPSALTWCSASNRLFIAGGSPVRIDVFDCAADTLVRSVAVDSLSRVALMCVNPVTRRLYLSDRTWYGNLWSVDPDSGRARLLSWRVSAIAVNPGMNKVYVANNDSLVVLDGSTETPRKRLEFGAYWERLWYNGRFNRVYALSWYGAVAAIMCAADSVSMLHLVSDPVEDCIGALTGDERYLCLVGSGDSLGPVVEVVSCSSNTIVGIAPAGWSEGSLVGQPGTARMCLAARRGVLSLIDCDQRMPVDLLVTTGSYMPELLTYDQEQDLLYCYCDFPGDELDLVAAVNPFSGAVCRFYPGASGFHPDLILRDSRYGKLYLIADSSAAATLDLSDGNVSRIMYGYADFTFIGQSANAERLYFVVRNGEASSFCFFDCAGDSVADSLAFYGAPVAVLCDPDEERVCAAFAGGELAVWNRGERRLSYRTTIDKRVEALAYAGRDRLCCISDTLVDIFDLALQERVGRLAIPKAEPKSDVYACDAYDRLYCVLQDTVFAVDVRNCRVAAKLALPGVVKAFYDRASGTLRCWTRDILVVIDCRTDRIVQYIPVGADAYDWSCGAWDSLRNRLYTRYGSNSIAVYADTVLPVVEPMRPIATAGVVRLADVGSRDLFDVAGRCRGRLVPGDNDVSTLPAGVYYVHRRSDSKADRVVILR